MGKSIEGRIDKIGETLARIDERTLYLTKTLDKMQDKGCAQVQTAHASIKRVYWILGLSLPTCSLLLAVMAIFFK